MFWGAMFNKTWLPQGEEDLKNQTIGAYAFAAVCPTALAAYQMFLDPSMSTS